MTLSLKGVENMGTICGADCAACSFRDRCRGCEKTCGRPFGGACVAAEFIKAQGKEAYEAFKGELLGEINALLEARGLPAADKLHELPGFFVDLAYPLPNGETARFLEGSRVYLGAQLRAGREDMCYGVVADREFILLCRYRAAGDDPELLLYQKR